jgi:hypothetical protein
MIKKIKIYDLDGTLIDSSHRYRAKDNRIDLAHWRENDTPDKVMQDSFLDLYEWLKVDLERKDTFVIFATARACVENDHNYEFLKVHNIVPDMFIHRQGNSDTRGGAELKIAAIKPLLNLKQFQNATIHIFEDNINYLHDMVTALKGDFEKGRKVIGHFVPSIQGH